MHPCKLTCICQAARGSAYGARIGLACCQVDDDAPHLPCASAYGDTAVAVICCGAAAGRARGVDAARPGRPGQQSRQAPAGDADAAGGRRAPRALACSARRSPRAGRRGCQPGDCETGCGRPARASASAHAGRAGMQARNARGCGALRAVHDFARCVTVSRRRCFGLRRSAWLQACQRCRRSRADSAARSRAVQRPRRPAGFSACAVDAQTAN